MVLGGSLGGKALGAFPLGLAQPMIIRQQCFGQDRFAPLGHLFGYKGHRSGASAPQGGRHAEHPRHIAVFIIAQSSPITNKKQGLFAIFYKFTQVGYGAGVVVYQPLVGGKVESGAVHLRAAGRQGP